MEAKRPLKGFVKSVRGKDGQTVVIKLQSGQTINIPRSTEETKGLLTGDKIWVYYDFTRDRIRKITKANPALAEEDGTTPPTEKERYFSDEDGEWKW